MEIVRRAAENALLCRPTLLCLLQSSNAVSPQWSELVTPATEQFLAGFLLPCITSPKGLGGSIVFQFNEASVCPQAAVCPTLGTETLKSAELNVGYKSERARHNTSWSLDQCIVATAETDPCNCLWSKHIKKPVKQSLIRPGCCLPTGTITETLLSRSAFQSGQPLPGDQVCSKTSEFYGREPTLMHFLGCEMSSLASEAMQRGSHDGK